MCTFGPITLPSMKLHLAANVPIRPLHITVLRLRTGNSLASLKKPSDAWVHDSISLLLAFSEVHVGWLTQLWQSEEHEKQSSSTKSLLSSLLYSGTQTPHTLSIHPLDKLHRLLFVHDSSCNPFLNFILTNLTCNT